MRRSASIVAVLLTCVAVVTPETSAVAQACDASLTGWAVPWPPTAGVRDVAARTDDDVWIVGLSRMSDPVSSRDAGYGLRWDGVEWSIHAAARPRTFRPEAVVDTGRRAWMIGDRRDRETGGDSGSEIQRWNGTDWRTARGVPLVVGRPSSRVWAIDASGPGDVWAAGFTSTRDDPLKTVVVRRSGGTWERVPAPIPGPASQDGSYVEDIVAIAPDDVWIVGTHYPEGARPFSLHWDGGGWTVEEVAINATLDAVAAGGPDDVWAVGRSGLGDAFVIHHDGDRWSQVEIDAGYASSSLYGVAVAPGGPVVTGSGSNVFLDDHAVAFQRSGTGWGSVSLDAVDGSEVSELYRVAATDTGTVVGLGAIGFTSSVAMRGCGF